MRSVQFPSDSLDLRRKSNKRALKTVSGSTSVSSVQLSCSHIKQDSENALCKTHKLPIDRKPNGLGRSSDKSSLSFNPSIKHPYSKLFEKRQAVNSDCEPEFGQYQSYAQWKLPHMLDKSWKLQRVRCSFLGARLCALER